jgi:hypothetical protein
MRAASQTESEQFDQDSGRHKSIPRDAAVQHGYRGKHQQPPREEQQ